MGKLVSPKAFLIAETKIDGATINVGEWVFAHSKV